MVTTEMRKMAKGRGRPKKETGEGTQVRVDSDIVAKAKYLAAGKKMTLGEYLSASLRPVIDRDFRKAAPTGEGGD